jgi:hypothetical protein
MAIVGRLVDRWADRVMGRLTSRQMGKIEILDGNYW